MIGNKHTAIRINNAQAAFVEIIMRCGGCTETEAQRVSDFYMRERLAKLDAVVGTINVKHGAYLDHDVIQRAILLAP